MKKVLLILFALSTLLLQAGSTSIELNCEIVSTLSINIDESSNKYIFTNNSNVDSQMVVFQYKKSDLNIFESYLTNNFSIKKSENKIVEIVLTNSFNS